MKATIIIRNLLLSSVLFLALSATSTSSRRQLPDESSVFVVGTVLRVAPFMYTDGMVRVTPLIVGVKPAAGPSLNLRVFCVGQAISFKCSELHENDRVQLAGEMRNLFLAEPSDHGAVELHTPGIAVTRVHPATANR